MWQLNDLQRTLVRLAIVTLDQVRHAVAAAHGNGMTWIEHLVVAGVVDEETVARCAAGEAVVPPCDFARLSKVPHEVVDLVPADLAVEHRVMPVRLDPDGDLCLAMVDPTDLAAVEEVGFFVGRHLLREVGLATAISWALHAYYRADSGLWSSPLARAAATR